MEKNNFCKRCRHMVSSRDTVCPYCGNRLEQKTEIRKKKSGSNFMYIIVLAPLILVMSAVCGFYIFSGDKTPQRLSKDDNPAEMSAAPETEDIPDEQTDNDGSVSEPAAEITPEPVSEVTAEPMPEQTSEPTPEPTHEPTPEPTPKQAESSPDKYGHTGKLPPVFTSYTASSAAEDVYSVSHAFDGSMDNVWGSGGENGGIREWIMMSSDEYQAVSGVRIFNGNTQNEEAFKANSRVKIAEVSFSDGSYIRKILQDGFSRNEPNIIRFNGIVNTKYVKITIIDKYGDSDVVCIGEIEVF